MSTYAAPPPPPPLRACWETQRARRVSLGSEQQRRRPSTTTTTQARLPLHHTVRQQHARMHLRAATALLCIAIFSLSHCRVPQPLRLSNMNGPRSGCGCGCGDAHAGAAPKSNARTVSKLPVLRRRAAGIYSPPPPFINDDDPYAIYYEPVRVAQRTFYPNHFHQRPFFVNQYLLPIQQYARPTYREAVTIKAPFRESVNAQRAGHTTDSVSQIPLKRVKNNALPEDDTLTSDDDVRHSLEGVPLYLDISVDKSQIQNIQERTRTSSIEEAQQSLIVCMDLQIALMRLQPNDHKTDGFEPAKPIDPSSIERFHNIDELVNEIRDKCRDTERSIEENVRDIEESRMSHGYRSETSITQLPSEYTFNKAGVATYYEESTDSEFSDISAKGHFERYARPVENFTNKAQLRERYFGVKDGATESDIIESQNTISTTATTLIELSTTETPVTLNSIARIFKKSVENENFPSTNEENGHYTTIPSPKNLQNLEKLWELNTQEIASTAAPTILEIGSDSVHTSTVPAIHHIQETLIKTTLSQPSNYEVPELLTKVYESNNFARPKTIHLLYEVTSTESPQDKFEHTHLGFNDITESITDNLVHRRPLTAMTYKTTTRYDTETTIPSIVKEFVQLPTSAVVNLGATDDAVHTTQPPPASTLYPNMQYQVSVQDGKHTEEKTKVEVPRAEPQDTNKATTSFVIDLESSPNNDFITPIQMKDISKDKVTRVDGGEQLLKMLTGKMIFLRNNKQIPMRYYQQADGVIDLGIDGNYLCNHLIEDVKESVILTAMCNYTKP